jgi:hypothetical protein
MHGISLSHICTIACLVVSTVGLAQSPDPNSASTNLIRNPSGGSTHRTVETTVYLTDAADLPAVIRAGRKYNPNGKQAGTLVYVKALAVPDARIEIEAVAARATKKPP